MKKGKSIAVIVVIAAILAGLAYYSFTILSSGGAGKDRNIILGLDLAGGVSITYQAVNGAPSAEDMSDTINKLERRVEGYSTEAQVYQRGDDRIVVEIPGVSDANKILEELGKPGSLEFQTPDGEVFMTGTDVEDAQAVSSQNSVGTNEYVVELKLTDEAAQKFADVTSANVGKRLPIVYDEEIISNPEVQSAITGGTALILGMGSFEEAEELASAIRIGSLSVELEEMQSEVVSAQLGTEAISTSLKAAAIGLVIVMIFMIVFYAVPGVVAAIALALYTALVVSVIYVFDVTLTLPGIAGIILSIGMAVDANVIIFARIREEIAAGRTTQNAIKAGFQKALSAILDGNITTLIAAAVLGIRGSGTVKGFAATLAIGIILSMFTALVITRFLMMAFHGLGAQNPKLYGKAKERKTINFVGRRYVMLAISIAIIVIGFGSMGVHGAKENRALNYSLEFVGGTSTTADFGKDYSLEEIDAQIVPVVSEVTGDNDIQIQKVQDSNSIVIKTRTLTLEERETLNQTLIEKFNVAEDTMETESISSTISSEMRNDALWAVIIAAICMLIYIWFRFKDVRFASAAVIALIHDILIVLTCYALTRISVGTTFIACMLTIIGYSINDTIVVFDRYRENIANTHVKDRESVKEVANRSITQTLSRSINTSITTLIMVIVLYIFGVATIKDFSLPLIVGVVSGTYSSIAVATGLWYEFRLRFGKNKLIAIPVKSEKTNQTPQAAVNDKKTDKEEVSVENKTETKDSRAKFSAIAKGDPAKGKKKSKRYDKIK